MNKSEGLTSGDETDVGDANLSNLLRRFGLKCHAAGCKAGGETKRVSAFNKNNQLQHVTLCKTKSIVQNINSAVGQFDKMYCMYSIQPISVHETNTRIRKTDSTQGNLI